MGHLSADGKRSAADRGTCAISALSGNARSSTLLDNLRVHAERLLSSAQVTDSYLLALAAARGGKLATFDRQLVTDAVVNGAQSLHLIE
jgi:predicted nucleic acid-binding protein